MKTQSKIALWGTLSILVILGMLISFTPAPVQAAAPVPGGGDPFECLVFCNVVANLAFGQCMKEEHDRSFCKEERDEIFLACVILCVSPPGS